MRQHVIRDRAIQWLACQRNRLKSRLQSRTPTLPVTGGVGGGGSDRWGFRKVAFAVPASASERRFSVCNADNFALSPHSIVDGLAHIQAFRKAAVAGRESYAITDGDKRPGWHTQAPHLAGVVERHNPHHSGTMAAPCSNALCCAFVANSIRFSCRLSVAS